jgi:GTP-binding protein
MHNIVGNIRLIGPVSAILSFGSGSRPAAGSVLRFFSTLAEKKFIDRVIVQARAGNGGHGCASIRKGRSGKSQLDGGNGGPGGDVVVKATSRVKSLAALPQLLTSKRGDHGSSKKQHGKRGADGVYLVPLGTQVRRFLERGNVRAVPLLPEDELREQEREQGVSNYTLDTEAMMEPFPSVIDLGLEPEDDVAPEVDVPVYEFVKDLVVEGDTATVAKGGSGGRGNVGVSRRSNHVSDHTLGEMVRVELEMKMISDFSLVGFPNVGKSSLLRKISSATPRVGSYPFTTVTPQLGSVSVGLQRFVVSDVPGLLHGAHANRGIGHEFLKHVERTSTVVYVLDAGGAYAMDDDGILLNPKEQLLRLQEELGHFSKDLLEKKWMVVINKMDLVKKNRGTFVEAFKSWLAYQYKQPPLLVCVSALATAKAARSISSIEDLTIQMKRVLSS